MLWDFPIVHLGKAYIIGGRQDSLTLKTVTVMDPKTGLSEKAAPMLSRRDAFAVTSSNSGIFVCGGYSWGNTLSTCECFKDER